MTDNVVRFVDCILNDSFFFQLRNILACKTSFKRKRIDNKNIMNLNEDAINICTHSICFDCQGIKVSPNVQDNIFAIVKKRNTVTYKYGASSV